MLLSIFQKRVIAYGIDFMAVVSVNHIVYLGIFPDFFRANYGNATSMMPSVLIIFPLLMIIFKDSVKGMSIGKWLLDIAIRDGTNTTVTPSIARLLIRNLFLLVSPIELLFFLIHNGRERLGDIVAKTILVEAPQKATKQAKFLVVSLLLGLFITAYLFLKAFIETRI